MLNIHVNYRASVTEPPLRVYQTSQGQGKAFPRFLPSSVGVFPRPTVCPQTEGPPSFLDTYILGLNQGKNGKHYPLP